MKPNLVPLNANRICLVCAHAKPRSEFVGDRGRTCQSCLDRRLAKHGKRDVPQGPRETPITNATSRGHYTGAELRPFAGRPGAMYAFALPSRMGDRLVYRSGRGAKQ